MRSTWLCSRNDLAANAGVLLAALTSYLMQSRWPDVIVGALIAGLFLNSSLGVLREALGALKAAVVAPPPAPGVIELRRQP